MVYQQNGYLKFISKCFKCCKITVVIGISVIITDGSNLLQCVNNNQLCVVVLLTEVFDLRFQIRADNICLCRKVKIG